MRSGDNLCIDIDRTVPDFSAMASAGVFEPSVFFCYEDFAKEEVYLPYVREEENYSLGGLNPGCYTRQPEFSLMICSSAESEEEL